MKRYFLTDDSGAPLDIDSLYIAHEEIKHAWSYDTKEELLCAFNLQAQRLNKPESFFKSVLQQAAFSILFVFAVIGIKRCIQLWL